MQPSTWEYFLTFSSETKIMKITHSASAGSSQGDDRGRRRNSLRFCGAVPKETHSIEKSSKFGKIKRNDNGSNILEEYQKRKYYRKMVQDCGGAYWNRSCALILSHHK